MVPRDPPAHIVPEIRSCLYFCFTIGGIAIMPTTVSTAPTTPEQAENTPHIEMEVRASPPRSFPIQSWIAMNSRSAMPDRSSAAPMNTKSGNAVST